MDGNTELTGKIEPFDSFWEAPEDIEKGHTSFPQFYRWNYLKHVTVRKDGALAAHVEVWVRPGTSWIC